MSTTTTRDSAVTRPRTRALWWGLGGAVALLVLSTVVPPLVGWDVHARADDLGPFAPLHGFWDPKVGVGTVPALLVAGLGVWAAFDLSARLPWRRLLLTSYVAGLAWLLSLALVDGGSGLTRVLGNEDEYLITARNVTDLGATLDIFISRIPFDATDNWPIHIAGHPAGALVVFVWLARIGLGGDLAAALVVTAAAASTAVAVLVTLRALGAEEQARRAAPFLVLTPAAVFMAVSADALFATVAAWGIAALALGATARTRGRGTGHLVGWSVLAGFLLGWCVLLSYGLPLLGVLALAVLLTARSWLPLPIAAITALAVVLAFAVAGFAWWEAYPVLHDRYYAGIASDRQTAYWVWGNLGALAYSAGPLVGAGLASLRPSLRHDPRTRVVLLLAGAGFAMVALADLSGMSKAEVERIWLPFIPWLSVSLALLPPSWRKGGLALQVGLALVVQHLLYTSW